MDILGLFLVPGEEPTPHALINSVIEYINQSGKEDHQFLKTEAENIQYSSESTTDTYLGEYTKVRERLVAAKYPGIEDEERTVDFALYGLKSTPSVTSILGPIQANKPETIKSFP